MMWCWIVRITYLCNCVKCHFGSFAVKEPETKAAATLLFLFFLDPSCFTEHVSWQKWPFLFAKREQEITPRVRKRRLMPGGNTRLERPLVIGSLRMDFEPMQKHCLWQELVYQTIHHDSFVLEMDIYLGFCCRKAFRSAKILLSLFVLPDFFIFFSVWLVY